MDRTYTVEVMCDMLTRAHPRAEQSKRWLCEAMLEILKEKPYHQITVTEICQRADLVRKTFYRHFTCKESVLIAIMDWMYEEFNEDVQAHQLESCEIPLAYFTYWEKHKFFLKMAVENQMFSLINDQYIRYLQAMEPWFGEQVIVNELEKEYMRIMVAGGLWNMLRKWVVRGCMETPEEMARMAITFFNLEDCQAR
ncbi:TetR/AcrR family transcriptional regulator [Paenibacillus sp. GCM10012307]|uniref:TetR/AcrR family transcriptional regulator n=1 Tax=Paenibacillus roseus TaxID=2798579 RepID=A0A934MRJ0_9BACL|nr:TetR/AcrR family transcriptional regulator [Paenibacillus roseus]MBJ6364316.1 TetR/AcrR family transcriptional regulator [Paenibacillus roseus]